MTKRTRKALRITEISGVDRPAQEGARALIMKRAPQCPQDDDRQELAKAACLTTSVEGHTHLLYTSGGDGEWLGGNTSWDIGHTHPWVRDASGNIIIGEANGHTHELATISKAETPAGDGIEPKEAEMAEDKALVELQKKLDRATALSTLNDVQKSFFNGLGADEQDAFLAKDAAGRDAAIKAADELAKAADPVVFTTSEGVEIRKSAGDAVLAMAKKADAAITKAAKLEAEALEADFAKRADTELAHLPGTTETRAAILKSVEGIEDEDMRKAAIESLKAQDNDMSKSFGTVGHAGAAPEATGASDQLDALAKAYAEANPGTSFAKAYSAVLDTEAGQALYAKTI